MAQKNINIGSSANKGDGEPLRTAFDKINDNFTELYNTVIGDSKGSVFGDDSTTLVDAVNSSINLAGTVKGDIVPDTNVAYDIGSATKRFKDLYLSGNTINLGGTAISIESGELKLGGVKIPSQTDLDTSIASVTAGKFSFNITGDDSTVRTVQSGSNISIKGGANITTASDVDGNITITGPDLSSYLTAETSHADVVVDGDFTSSGFMKTDGAGNYSVDSATYLSAITLGQVTEVDINDPQDNQVLSYNTGSGDWVNANLNWGNITGTPTTIAGYGITDAFDGTYASLSGSPTALSDFTNDLDYAPIVGGAIQTNGLPSGTEVTDGIFAKQGQPLSIGYKDLGGSNTSIFVDETIGVQFFKDVVFDNVTVDFTTSSIVNTPFAETGNLAIVATSGDYDDLTNKPTDLVTTTMTSAIDANSFDISNLFAITLQTQTSAVIGATEGTVVIADGVNWNPLGNGRKSMVVYLGGDWREIATVPGV